MAWRFPGARLQCTRWRWARHGVAVVGLAHTPGVLLGVI